MAAVTRPSNSSNLRWVVCFLLFLATTINYMDRSVFSLIEPVLHGVSFMGWNPAADKFHQPVFDNNFGNVVIFFQIAYGIGLLISGRVVDRLGTKAGYALQIGHYAQANAQPGAAGTAAPPATAASAAAVPAASGSAQH